MSLSTPNKRTPIHTRQIKCQGYKREDGLWDIEGHLTDVRAHNMETFGRGKIEAGEPLHEMMIRMTVDGELRVTNIEAKTMHAPYPSCPHFPKRFSKLIGAKIEPGWTAKVRMILGGKWGCTHLVELLGPVATTAVQTVFAWRAEESANTENLTPPEDFINSCHSLVENGEVVKQLWPQHIVAASEE